MTELQDQAHPRESSELLTTHLLVVFLAEQPRLLDNMFKGNFRMSVIPPLTLAAIIYFGVHQQLHLKKKKKKSEEAAGWLDA